MRLSWLAYVFVLTLPLTAAAQVPEADTEARLRALEEQVKALQAEIAALKGAREGADTPAVAAPAPPAPTPQPETASALAAAPIGGEAQPAGPLPVYGGGTSKALNPDVGMIGNFIAAAGPSQGGSESLAPQPSLSLQESEMSLQAIVDPYARADFFLAIGEEASRSKRGS